MKATAIILTALFLTGCQKFQDSFRTGVDGYVLRCIDGTQYVLMTSERGLAITPHLNADNKPKACVEEKK